ncbi:hypothetical protein ACF0H5_003110 [Mactra antiquata]
MKTSYLCRTLLVLMVVSLLVSATEAWWSERNRRIGGWWWRSRRRSGSNSNVAKRSTDIDMNDAEIDEIFKDLVVDSFGRGKRQLENLEEFVQEESS